MKETKIKKLRIKSGMSQEALADNSQLNLRTIQRIESGTTVARGDSLQRIAGALGVSVEDLMDTVIQVDNKITGLEKDPWIIRLLYISALGFLLFPLPAILLPLAVWIMYRNKISGMYQKGKQLLIAQSIWCIVLLGLYVYIGGIKILHFNLPVPNNQKTITIIIAALYLANIIYCVTYFITSFEIRKYFTQATVISKTGSRIAE